MHFTFWKVEPGIIDPGEPRYEPIGSCYIPLSKLMSEDFTIVKDEMNNIHYANRDLKLTEKLWHHGRELGVANLSIKFKMQTHMRQMQSCVRTEDGIMTSSPIFSNFAGKECEDIVALDKINTAIQR